jgi:hypothetical protein
MAQGDRTIRIFEETGRMSIAKIPLAHGFAFRSS